MTTSRESLARQPGRFTKPEAAVEMKSRRRSKLVESEGFKLSQYIPYLLMSGVGNGISLLPRKAQKLIIGLSMQTISFCIPRFQKIARKNAKIVFPEKSPAYHQNLADSCISMMTLLLVDFIRIKKVDRKWMKEHFSYDGYDEVQELRKKNPEKGILYATGHLGSFELLAQAMCLLDRPFSFVVRRFNNLYMDRWWQSFREWNGNETISREGAYKATIRKLRAGEDVGILFDQNIRVHHAVFVNWFGKRGATSKLLALAAIKTEAPIVMLGTKTLAKDRYTVDTKVLDCSDVYRDESLSLEDKVKLITQRAADQYCEMIRENPMEWFWMHRKFKTTPDGLGEDFYEQP